MVDRALSICITLTVGLALAMAVLLVSTAAAGPPPPAAFRCRPQATGATHWGSDWVAIPAGTAQVFEHSLGRDPDDYAVEMWFRDRDGGLGINRRNYGGLEWGGSRAGAHWEHLTANTIEVYRQPNDNVADYVRVRVWIPTQDLADYEGEWMDIDPAQTITITHDVGITATELTVGLWFSSTARGIHHYGYGGLTIDGPPLQRQGAFWHNLTDTTVQVTRFAHDSDIEQVRVAVVHADPPDYDSLQALGGWESITQNTLVTLTHGLHWNPNSLLVRGECQAPLVQGVGGIHQLYAGGNHDPALGWQGTELRNLTADTVAVARRQDDQVCPQVRVRIWKRSLRVYLPLVLRGS